MVVLNPLSFLLQNFSGYMLGSATARDINVIHNFFVDNLKICAKNVNNAKKKKQAKLIIINKVGDENIDNDKKQLK